MFERQIALPEIGEHGQRRIRDANVAIVGVGGLGAIAAQALAAAGVGQLTLIDHDAVQATNLHRQYLYGHQDVGRNKVVVAAEKFAGYPVAIRAEPVELMAANAEQLMTGHDVVLDCTDRVAARHAINDAARELEIPWIHAAVSRFEGQIAFFIPGGPCYTCLYPAAPEGPACSGEGIPGPVPSVLGALQATWALRSILELPLPSTLVLLDLATGESTAVPRLFNRHCPCRGGLPRYESVFLQPSAMQTGDILLDVRNAGEHPLLPQALLIPLQQIRDAQLPAGRIVCICRTGWRAQQAARILRHRGFDAYALEGGMAAMAT